MCKLLTQVPQIFAKGDLLPIENDREKKQVVKKNIKHFKFPENYWQRYSLRLHVIHKTSFD